MSLVNANDMYKQRIETPNHLRCFIKMNDSINRPIFKQQETINKTMMYAVLKVQARQEISLSKRMIDQADSTFKSDSVKFEQTYRLGN